MTIEQLRAHLKALADEHATLSAKYDDLTPEQHKRLEEIDAEYEAGEAKLKALTKSAAMKSGLSQSAGRTSTPGQPANEARITGGERVIDQDPRRGYEHIGEFAQDVARACAKGGAQHTSERLRAIAGIGEGGIQSGAPTTYGSEGVGVDGGFAVPPEFRGEIWNVVYGTGSILAAANPIVTSQSAVVETVSEWTPWGSGGVQGSWVGEGAVITQSKPATRQATTSLHKFAALVPATEELIEDAPRLMNLLMQQAPECIRYNMDDAIINGNGVAKPLGVMNGPSIIEEAKETNQTAKTVVPANLAKMWGRLLPGSHMRASWLVSPDTYQQIITMTLGDQPAFMPANQAIQNAPMGTIFGRPIIVSHVCQTAGTAGDVILADFNGYISYTKGSIKFSQSMHLFFDADAQAFKWTYRLGGQPRLSAAVNPGKGSTTIGHFIRIAARG